MTRFNFLEYFKGIAQTNRSILHSESNYAFSRIASVFELSEFLTNMSDLDGFQMLCVDQEKGKLIDNRSDNLLSNRFFSFYLLHRVIHEDFDDKQAVLASCKTLMLQILSKMHRDRRLRLDGLQYIDLNSFTFDQVGSFGQNWRGYTCSFTTLEPVTLMLDGADWL